MTDGASSGPLQAWGRLLAVDVVGAGVVGVLAGAAAAVFLAGLGLVTATRDAHASLFIPLLPIAAALLLELVARLGTRAGGGTTVVLDVAHRGSGEPIPFRLALVALLGTWWTHLFGGSAGREGTAVQMGSALADAVVHAVRRILPVGAVDAVDDDARRHLIIAGIAGGFGGVFGTPVAACVFAMEVVVARRIDTRAALAALIGAVAGDVVGAHLLHALGGAHGHYPTLSTLPVALPDLLRFAALGIVTGVVGLAFITLLHGVKHVVKARPPWQRGLLGGAVVVVIWWVVPGAEPLVGLSVPTLEAAVSGTVAVPWVFALKLVLTAVTLGVGLVGGEVTPLFVIGATLGVTLAGPLGLPPEHAACAALAAMFGACAGTPVALLCMVVELCGAGAIAQQTVTIVVASVVVGGRSIYTRPR